MEVKIPKKYRSLFWDTDFDKLSWKGDKKFISLRILEYGSLEAIRWLLGHIDQEKLKEFIINGGWKRLSPKTLNFWELILGIEEEECSKISSQKRGNPFWKF